MLILQGHHCVNNRCRTLITTSLALSSVMLTTRAKHTTQLFDTRYLSHRCEQLAVVADVTYKTARVAMLQQLENPTPEFASAIVSHFRSKKAAIMQMLDVGLLTFRRTGSHPCFCCRNGHRKLTSFLATSAAIMDAWCACLFPFKLFSHSLYRPLRIET